MTLDLALGMDDENFKMPEKIKKVQPWQLKCKHKIIIVNSMMQKNYCKRCGKNLSDLKYHDFVTKKIEAGKWVKSYAGEAELWDDTRSKEENQMSKKIKVESSNLEFVEYIADTKELRIWFLKEKNVMYTYAHVPAELYTDLINAESIGKFFRIHIKHKYKHTMMSVDFAEGENKTMISFQKVKEAVSPLIKELEKHVVKEGTVEITKEMCGIILHRLKSLGL